MVRTWSLMFAAAAVALPAHAQDRPKPLPVARDVAVVGFDRDRLRRLDDYFTELVDKGTLPGISYVLARHGRTVTARTIGKADIASNTPLASDAIFRIASMTKPITGVAMMMLFEEGKWRLDDPISQHIPEFKNLRVFKSIGSDGKVISEPADHEPTMRELLSHTAGFGYGIIGNTPVDKLYTERGVMRSQGLQQVIDKLAPLPLLYQPGTKWVYSLSVDIQGYLVEKLSGMPFGQFLKTRMFNPLGMKDTAFWLPPETHKRLVTLYRSSPDGSMIALKPGEGLPSDAAKPPAFEGGGGGLVSTINDYARFAQMVTNNGELDGVRILSPATVELMGTNALAEGVFVNTNGTTLSRPNPEVRFGLNFSVIDEPRKAGTLEGKGVMAWGGAFGTWFWVDRTNDLFFVAFIQRQGLAGEDVRGKSRTLVYQALTQPAR